LYWKTQDTSTGFRRDCAAIAARLRRSVSKDAFRDARLDVARTVAFYNRIQLNEKNCGAIMSNHSLSAQTNTLPGVVSRILIFLYGAACYLVFLATFAYMIGFVGNLIVPKAIDSGTSTSFPRAILTDVGLIALFGVQHAVMAREKFKKWWTRIVPASMERSTYVLVASLMLLFLAWQWQPLPQIVWNLDSPVGSVGLQAVFWLGWLTTLVSTFLINHFDLFGLRQTYLHLRGTEHNPLKFMTPFLYRIVRHPMMLGLVLGFWATPRMSVGHLVFAAGMTVYILIGITLEERGLVRQFGDQYRDYQRKTRMLIPAVIRARSNDR
jgi:protein-S-isoprenylcysteine O-methyltransferase Ste14